MEDSKEIVTVHGVKMSYRLGTVEDAAIHAKKHHQYLSNQFIDCCFSETEIFSHCKDFIKMKNTLTHIFMD